MNNKILIVGGDHYNTLGIVESLGQKGLSSYVILHGSNIGKKLNYVLKSKYVIKGWVCKTDEEVLATMKANFNDTNDKRTIVFTAADADACLLDSHWTELENTFILPGANGEVRNLISKKRMAELAQMVGITIPDTIIIDESRIIPDRIIYPCITKAISSVDGSKDNLHICKDEEELRNFISTRPKELTFLVQRYIDKAFEFQLMGCSMIETKEVIIPGRSYLDRPNGINNAYFLQYNICDETFNNTLDKAREFVLKTGYRGLFSIEYLRDKEGFDYFMEMNFRNDGNSVCVTDAGTNLPYIWYLYYSGGDYNKEIESSSVKEVFWQPELYYFLNVFTKEITWKEWWNNVKRTNSYSNYFKDDKKPWRWFLFIEAIHASRKFLHIFNHKSK